MSKVTSNNKVTTASNELTILEKLLNGFLTVKELKNAKVGYLEPAEKVNNNIHGFRTIELSKYLASTLNVKQLHPLLVTTDFKSSDKCFLFDTETISKLKDGESVPDGREVSCLDVDFIVTSGRQRTAALLRFGNATTKIHGEIASQDAINTANIQKSQSNSAIMSKIIYNFLNDESKTFDLKKEVQKSGANWTAGTYNNNKTSIALILEVLKSCNETQGEVLKNLIFDDIFSFTHCRKLLDFLPKESKEFFELNRYQLDDSGKTLKIGTKNVPNEKFGESFVSMVFQYFEFCGEEISVGKQKVDAFWIAIKLTSMDKVGTETTTTGENVKEKYKLPGMDKVISGSMGDFESEAENLHKYINSLDVTEKSDVELNSLFDNMKGSFNTLSPYFVPYLIKTKNWLLEKEVLQVKALNNKIFTTVKIDKDTTKLELSKLFVLLLESLDDDEKLLLSDSLNNIM
jgi:hypothetical protein